MRTIPIFNFSLRSACRSSESDIRAMTKYSSQPLFPLVIFSWLGMLWGLLTEVNFFFSLRFGSLGVVGGETTNNEEHHTYIIATGPWWIAGDNVLKYIIVGWQSCPFAHLFHSNAKETSRRFTHTSACITSVRTNHHPSFTCYLSLFVARTFSCLDIAVLYSICSSIGLDVFCLALCYGYLSVSSNAIVVDQPDFFKKQINGGDSWSLTITTVELDVGDPGEDELMLLSRSRSNLNVV